MANGQQPTANSHTRDGADMADDPVENPPVATAAPQPADAASQPQVAEALRCQWCSVPLDPGVTVCPRCGSAGVPDPVATAQAQALAEAEAARRAPASPAEDAPPAELKEWWKDEIAEATSSRRQLTYDEVERRRNQTLLFIAGAVIVCAFLGWLAGPLLRPAMENLTGTPVEDTGDLRPTGLFLGVLFGFLVGATGGWVIQSSK